MSDINECDVDPCDVGQVCVNTPGFYRCDVLQCPTGYKHIAGHCTGTNLFCLVLRSSLRIKCVCRPPSVSRDNGKTSLLGVEDSKELLLPRDVPGRKDRKVKSRRESILLKNKYEKLLKIM